MFVFCLFEILKYLSFFTGTTSSKGTACPAEPQTTTQVSPAFATSGHQLSIQPPSLSSSSPVTPTTTSSVLTTTTSAAAIASGTRVTMPVSSPTATVTSLTTEVTNPAPSPVSVNSQVQITLKITHSRSVLFLLLFPYFIF
jgi:hypothetical protein